MAAVVATSCNRGYGDGSIFQLARANFVDATLAPGKETADTRGPSFPEYSVRRDLELNNVRSAHRGLGPRVNKSRGSPPWTLMLLTEAAVSALESELNASN